MLSPCSDLHQTALYPSISSPRPTLHFVYVRMHLKCERLLQQWGKRKGDQPAHVERHGCSLMWLQLGSPGPNEVLWSSAAPSPIAYTPAAHILPLLHHSGSLRRCSQIPQGTLEMEKKEQKRGENEKMTALKIGTQEFGWELLLHLPAATPCSQHTHTKHAHPWPPPASA